jgi:transposase
LRTRVGAYPDRMKPGMFVRPLAAAERQALRRGLKSADAFTLRRSQVLLSSADGKGAAEIGRLVGVTAQAVRDIIRAFQADGLGCLARKSNAPKAPNAAWDRARDEDLKDLLHRRPREFGEPTSLWTLGLVARVCHAKGWTGRVLTAEAVRLTLKRLGVGWQRAKHWITSPDPAYAKKKRPGTG